MRTILVKAMIAVAIIGAALFGSAGLASADTDPGSNVGILNGNDITVAIPVVVTGNVVSILDLDLLDHLCDHHGLGGSAVLSTGTNTAAVQTKPDFPKHNHGILNGNQVSLDVPIIVADNTVDVLGHP